jgi:hypothetical protein
MYAILYLSHSGEYFGAFIEEKGACGDLQGFP